MVVQVLELEVSENQIQKYKNTGVSIEKQEEKETANG